MALPPRDRLLILVGVASLLTVLPGCGSRKRESLGTGGQPLIANWAEAQGFARDTDAIEGARIFARVGCLQCHTYLGSGAKSLDAADLSSVGKTSNRSAEAFAAYLADPSKFGSSVMPKYANLGETNLRKLGIFLEASKGSG
jgi:mono/diheme cytochrome c family protein